MANEYGFFAAKEHDRRYSADDFSALFSDFFTDGVKGGSTQSLMVTAAGDMDVSIAGGTAYIKGRWFRRSGSTLLTLPECDTEYDRYDAIVLRCSNAERAIYPAYIEGIPSAAPEKPSPVRNSDIYDLVLAYVYVAENTPEITQADISDERGGDLCGWVTNAIQNIDTTGLFAQYQAAWDGFIASLASDERITINTADYTTRKAAEVCRNDVTITSMTEFV